jgi:hypothetical protein
MVTNPFSLAEKGQGMRGENTRTLIAMVTVQSFLNHRGG